MSKSSNPFVSASSDYVLDVSGQLNILPRPDTQDNSGVRFYRNDKYVGLTAPTTITTSTTFKLPESDGQSNEILTTDGKGNLSWTTVTRGDKGEPGAGDKGEKGETGSSGTGTKGENGNFGGLSFPYEMNTNTNIPTAPLLVGKIRFDRTSQKDAENIYISKLDIDSNNLTTFLSSHKGHIRIAHRVTSDRNILYEIINISNDVHGNFILNVRNIAATSKQFSDQDEIFLTFTRTGDKGDSGDKGEPGEKGADSTVKGDKGESGKDGDKGENSVVPGPQGDKGSKGEIGPQGPAVEGGGVLPYEPYSIHNANSLTSMYQGDIFYAQFFVPTTGKYTALQFYTLSGVGDNWVGKVGAAIYKSTGSGPGSPGDLIHAGYSTITLKTNMHRKYVDITFDSPQTLNSHTKYWAAVTSKADNQDHGLSMVTTSTSNNAPTTKETPAVKGTFPTTANSTQSTDAGFWFRLYNPSGGVGSGPKGDKGEASSVVGPAGPKGDDGAKGEPGADSTVAGPKGEDGAKGEPGADSTVAGPKGDDGAKGDPGADSTVAGPKGEDGKKGEPGADSTVAGPKGDDGAKGDPGADSTVAGPKGEDGKKGEPGADSTVAGPKGDDGAKGDPGADSTVAGPKGEDGKKGEPGADSTVAGPKGDDGAKGDPGADSTVAGPKGVPGSASLAIRLKLTTKQTNITTSYYGILFNTTPTFIQGDTWTVTGGGGTIGTYIKTSTEIKAFFSYGFSIDDNTGNNGNVYVKIQTTTTPTISSSWQDINGSKITNSSPSQTPYYYGSSGTCMATLAANTYVRAAVYSTKTNIDLEAGVYGDTYLSIFDMFGGSKGDTGADSTVAGPKGDSGDKGDKGIKGAPGADSTVAGQKGDSGDKGEPGQKGEIGADSTVAGPKGEPGADSTVAGPKGEAGADSTVAGPKGDEGKKGETGAKGDKGDTGSKGDKGNAGLDGNFGGATFDYTFDGSTDVPSWSPASNAGKLRLNKTKTQGQHNSDIIYIHATNDEGNSIKSFLETIDAIDSNIKGFVRITLKTDSTKFLMFSISDLEDNTSANGSWKVTVTNVGYSTTDVFSDGQDILASWATSGKKGDKGEPGKDSTVKGEKGGKGEVGVGEKGEKGQRGSNGIGEKGMKGVDGLKGESGINVNYMNYDINTLTMREAILSDEPPYDSGSNSPGGEIGHVNLQHWISPVSGSVTHVRVRVANVFDAGPRNNTLYVALVLYTYSEATNGVLTPLGNAIGRIVWAVNGTRTIEGNVDTIEKGKLATFQFSAPIAITKNTQYMIGYNTYVTHVGTASNNYYSTTTAFKTYHPFVTLWGADVGDMLHGGWGTGTSSDRTGWLTSTSDERRYKLWKTKGNRGEQLPPTTGTGGRGTINGLFNINSEVKYHEEIWWFNIYGPQTLEGATAGPKGEAGIKGEIGDKGSQGDKGEVGADSTVAGPKGDQGQKGQPGADSTVAGPKGDQGQKGQTGADSTVAGPKGTKGELGTKGTPGTDGDKGDTGDKGNSGIHGGIIHSFQFDNNDSIDTVVQTKKIKLTNRSDSDSFGQAIGSCNGCNITSKSTTIHIREPEEIPDSIVIGLYVNQPDVFDVGTTVLGIVRELEPGVDSFLTVSTQSKKAANGITISFHGELLGGTQKTARKIQVSNTNFDNAAMKTLFDSMDDGNNSVRGYLSLHKPSDSTKFLNFAITGASTESTLNTTFNVSNVAFSDANPFTNNENLLLSYHKAGNKGDKGQAGADGTGNKGEPGVSIKGDKGDKGDTGAVGQKGRSGEDSTVAGPKGEKGEIGNKGDASTTAGPQGDKGNTGSVGSKGDPTGNFRRFQIAAFDVSTPANPTAKKISFNSKFGKSNEAYISGIDLDDVLSDAWVSQITKIGGIITFQAENARAKQQSVHITGFTNHGLGATGWSTITFSPIDIETEVPSVNDILVVSFSPKGSKGDTGAAGSNGAKGDTGATGQKGATGAAGSNGAKGDTGQKGEVGVQGIQGLTGATGAAGSNGAKGDTGAAGSNGAKGQKGERGAVGLQGDKGDVGPQGVPGANGNNGSNGSDGSDGAKGDTGATGQKGATGVAGSNGAKGQKGEPGSIGLQGVNGAKGDTGATGQKGAPGSNGSNGSTGAKGDTGATGQKGAAGSNGSNGSTGAKGEPGSNGSNGSTGAKGEPGSNGSNGSTGAKGQKGATGSSGSNGSTGAKGQKGAAGSNGSTGAQGPKGEPGEGADLGKICLLIDGCPCPRDCGGGGFFPRTTGGHYYQMGEDLTGQEGCALILKSDGKVYKSTVVNDKKIIGFFGEIVSGKDSIQNTERDQLAFVVGIGDSYHWKTIEEVDSSGNTVQRETKYINGIKVCNEGGDIEVGDLLVTSSRVGYFMKQSDDLIRNYTAARCAQTVTFGGDTEKSGIYCIMMCG